MANVINIRGANGAGKSTVVKQLLDAYRATSIVHPATKKVVGYQLATEPQVYVIGRYQSPCGGADTVASFRELKELIGTFAAKGHVIVEGSLISTVYKGSVELAKALPGHHFIFAVLTTPKQECLDRLARRREVAGTSQPLNMQQVLQKHASVASSAKRLAESGFDLRELPHQRAPAVVMEWLGIERHDDDSRHDATRAISCRLPLPTMLRHSGNRPERKDKNEDRLTAGIPCDVRSAVVEDCG